MNDAQRDVRLALETSRLTAQVCPHCLRADPREVRRARIACGTLRRISLPGQGRLARLWNWFVDADYTAVGPPPIAWFVSIGGLVAVIASAATYML